MILFSNKADAKAAGAKFYFTGVHCKNGHLSKRFVSDGGCFDCRSNGTKKWRGEHRDKVNKNALARHWSNREENLKRMQDWHNKNREKKNRQRRKWSEEHKEHEAARSKEYRLKNPEVYIAAQHRRRKLEKDGHKISTQDIRNILEIQSYKCLTCCKDLRDGYHVDHIMPLSKGGSNTVKNIQMLCPSCNLHKSAKLPHKFMQEMGFLI